MSTPTFDTTSSTVSSTDETAGRVTWKRGLLTGLVAAVVATAVAAVFRAAGHDLSVVDQDGESGAIPLLAFAQFVLIGTVIGILVARHTSRTTFVRVTVALTALSCVPSLVWGSTATDKVGLVVIHLAAAAIVIPRLARR